MNKVPRKKLPEEVTIEEIAKEQSANQDRLDLLKRSVHNCKDERRPYRNHTDF